MNRTVRKFEERTAEDIERRKAWLEQFRRETKAREQFNGAIMRAYEKRDPVPLCEYLRSNQPLSEEQRSDIATLIQRVLRSRRGRPPGSQPTRQLEQLLIDRAFKERDRQRRILNLQFGEPLPKGSLNKIIDKVAQSDEFDGEFTHIDRGARDRMFNNIRKALLCGVKRNPDKSSR